MAAETQVAAGGPRIGLLGFFIESNRWAAPAGAGDFEQTLDVAGPALMEALRQEPPRVLPDLIGFDAAMRASGAWTPVPVRVAACQPSGPVEHGYFEALLQDIDQRLLQAGPLDGVFISSHGAAITTQIDDPDAMLFERVRQRVGPTVPVVAVLDLHANISTRMTAALSALVAYRTNPHIDLTERGAEAARHLRRLLADGPGFVAHVKLPFVPASTTLLTAPGQPYRELLDQAERALAHEQADCGLLNISLCAGFAFADAPDCGFSVTVSALRHRAEAAHAMASALARSVWSARHGFTPRLTPVDEAVAAAKACGLGVGPRLILADVADNPGGGGGGNTVTLLRALHEADARGVLLGVFCDATLAAEAHARGVGATFEAVFNRQPAPPWAPSWCVGARVVALGDGEFVGRRGLLRGTRASMGPTARLALQAARTTAPTEGVSAGQGQDRAFAPHGEPTPVRGGVEVIVISQRQQLLDPAQLDGLGLNLAGIGADAVRTLVVKSRGHFRAAFDDFAPTERILEVDAPGLTSPNLRHLPWRRMPRPVYPIDEGVCWPDDGGQPLLRGTRPIK